MIRIIYLDIDGTLRDDVAGISVKTKAALQQCQTDGIQVVACTGRSPDCVQEDVLALGLDGIISGGGCYIRYRNTILFSRHLPPLIVERFLDYADTCQFGISLELEQGLYMNDSMADFYQADFHRKLSGCSGREIAELLRRNKLSYRDTIARYRPGRDLIHKICVIGEHNRLKELQSRLAGSIQAVQDQPWGGKWYLECLPAGCSKGTAVERLNQFLHIPRECSMSFGDGGNDIDLLQAAGTGVAVAGGDPRLLRLADSVCEPPSQDGIYKELARRNIILSKAGRSVLYEQSLVAKRSGLSDLSQEFLRQ